MPFIAYSSKSFKPDTLAIIERANYILDNLRSQGYSPSLRQLYYQFVKSNWLPNKPQSYKKLGKIVADARMCGRIDWNAIEDRGRYVREVPNWDTPADIIEGAAHSYRVPIWENQSNHVEVWIEKDALVGVIERPCNKYRVPFLSTRGYMSHSEMWEASQRMGQSIRDGKTVTILHLGDHDPSGIDMTRDIHESLFRFIGSDMTSPDNQGMSAASATVEARQKFHVKRIGLTMEQIEQYDPPPNPAKESDSRATGYMDIYGDESWELDALEPAVLSELIEDHVQDLIDWDPWEKDMAREKRERTLLKTTSDHWASDVVEFVEDL